MGAQREPLDPMTSAEQSAEQASASAAVIVEKPEQASEIQKHVELSEDATLSVDKADERAEASDAGAKQATEHSRDAAKLEAGESVDKDGVETGTSESDRKTRKERKSAGSSPHGTGYTNMLKALLEQEAAARAEFV